MNFLTLTIAGLKQRPVSAALTWLSVVAAFTLFGVVQGFDQSFRNTIGGLDESAGRLFVSSRVSQVDPLPWSYLSDIEKIPDVAVVVPSTYFLGYHGEPGNWIGGFAVDIEREFAAFPEYQISQLERASMGRLRDGAIAGRSLALKYGWKTGDRVPLTSQVWLTKEGTRDWAFEIVGIYDAADADAAQGFFINHAFLDDARAFAHGTVSTFVVRVKPGADPAAVGRAIDARFANSPDETVTQTERQLLRNRMQQLGNIGLMVDAIAGATLFVLLFLTSNIMRHATTERMSEFATLKAMGFADTYVLWLVTAEALIVTCTGAVAGLALAVQVIGLLPQDFGDLSVPWQTFAWAAFFACVIAVAASLLPALRAKNVAIVEALRRA